MIFTINNGPLAGREGKYVQLRKIKNGFTRKL
jgi:predicted membrane GTPase involved in stress response